MPETKSLAEQINAAPDISKAERMTFSVTGMTCAACQSFVQRALEKHTTQGQPQYMANMALNARILLGG